MKYMVSRGILISNVALSFKTIKWFGKLPVDDGLLCVILVENVERLSRTGTSQQK